MLVSKVAQRFVQSDHSIATATSMKLKLEHNEPSYLRMKFSSLLEVSYNHNIVDCLDNYMTV